MRLQTMTQLHTMTAGPPLICDSSEKSMASQPLVWLTKPKRSKEETPPVTLITENETPKFCRSRSQRMYECDYFRKHIT